MANHNIHFKNNFNRLVMNMTQTQGPHHLGGAGEFAVGSSSHIKNTLMQRFENYKKAKKVG